MYQFWTERIVIIFMQRLISGMNGEEGNLTDMSDLTDLTDLADLAGVSGFGSCVSLDCRSN